MWCVAVLLVVLYCMCRNLSNICPWVNFITKRGEPSRNMHISLFDELLHVKHTVPSVYWCVRCAGVSDMLVCQICWCSLVVGSSLVSKQLVCMTQAMFSFCSEREESFSSSAADCAHSC